MMHATYNVNTVLFLVILPLLYSLFSCSCLHPTRLLELTARTSRAIIDVCNY